MKTLTTDNRNVPYLITTDALTQKKVVSIAIGVSNCMTLTSGTFGSNKLTKQIACLLDGEEMRSERLAMEIRR
jgi:hypothetical protein